MKKCKYCNSIWVCWNWIYVPKDKYKELNPHKNIKTDFWGHECWKCEGCQETSYQVKNGIPYFILYHFYGLFKGIIK